MNKKILSLIFLTLFLIGLQEVFAVTITEGNLIRSSLYSQKPVIVEPGNYVEVRFRLENNGGNTLKNFEVEILPKFPFYLDSGERALRSYGSFTPSNKDYYGILTTWKLRVSEDAIEGNNEIRLRYRYDGSDWVHTSPFDVSVETREVILEIKDIRTIPEEISPGQEFDLKINLKNYADTSIRNLKIDLNSSSTFYSMGSTDKSHLRLLKSGEEAELTFTLISRGDANDVIYNIPLTISYFDNRGSQSVQKSSFGLILLEKPSLIKTLDRTRIITGGDRGEVDIEISNVGVNGIKFAELRMIPSEDYIILSKNPIYLGNIDSDDYEIASFNVLIDSKEKNVLLNYELVYRDVLNREYKENFALNHNLYSLKEARNLGLKEPSNFAGTYISFTVILILLIFWFYMLIDLSQRKLPRYKKITWGIILILTTFVGAVLYYFMMGRKK